MGVILFLDTSVSTYVFSFVFPLVVSVLLFYRTKPLLRFFLLAVVGVFYSI